MTGDIPGRRRLPQNVTRSAEIQFVGASGGSLRLKLNLPKPDTLVSESDLESVKQSLLLMLEVVNWASSTEEIEDLNAKADDTRLIQLLLGQVQRIGPTPRSAFQKVEFSGRVSGNNGRFTLSRKSMVRIQNALQKTAEGTVRDTSGEVTYPVALDAGEFELSGRDFERPPLHLVVPREVAPQIAEREEENLLVSGVLRFDRQGRPSSLLLERIVAADEGD